MTDLNLVLLGPPGAGKGTQAARLRDELALAYVSTGDLLRRHRANGTELGLQAASHMAEGRLVPDELVISMLMLVIEDGPPHGFLLDGFPRTVVQADALEAALDDAGTALLAVLLIDAPDEVIIDRISGRLTCPHGHVFHIQNSQPQREGVCDLDGEPLSQRDDDLRETVRRRLDVYHEQTEPLVAYYGRRGLLLRVDGTRPPDEVFDTVRTVLGFALRRGRPRPSTPTVLAAAYPTAGLGETVSRPNGVSGGESPEGKPEQFIATQNASERRI